MKKIAFLELSHIFANQVKLPYSTGCIWSYCRTIDEISNNFSFDLHDWFYVLDGEFDAELDTEWLLFADETFPLPLPLPFNILIGVTKMCEHKFGSNMWLKNMIVLQ